MSQNICAVPATSQACPGSQEYSYTLVSYYYPFSPRQFTTVVTPWNENRPAAVCYRFEKSQIEHTTPSMSADSASASPVSSGIGHTNSSAGSAAASSISSSHQESDLESTPPARTILCHPSVTSHRGGRNFLFPPLDVMITGASRRRPQVFCSCIGSAGSPAPECGAARRCLVYRALFFKSARRKTKGIVGAKTSARPPRGTRTAAIEDISAVLLFSKRPMVAILRVREQWARENTSVPGVYTNGHGPVLARHSPFIRLGSSYSSAR